MERSGCLGFRRQPSEMEQVSDGLACFGMSPFRRLLSIPQDNPMGIFLDFNPEMCLVTVLRVTHVDHDGKGWHRCTVYIIKYFFGSVV